MGQQQLLLVILVTIIVGIATVVAINVFGTSAASANEDAVRQDILTIASASQGWYIKPEMMGGGGNSFTGITFRDFNFSAASINSAGDIASNMNGTYQIDGSGGDNMTVDAWASSMDGYTVDDTSPHYNSGDPTLEAMICQSDIEWGSSADCTTSG
jgi:hypothetical protein